MSMSATRSPPRNEVAEQFEFLHLGVRPLLFRHGRWLVGVEIPHNNRVVVLVGDDRRGLLEQGETQRGDLPPPGLVFDLDRADAVDSANLAIAAAERPGIEGKRGAAERRR